MQDEIRIMLKYAKENPMREAIVLLLLQTGTRAEEPANFIWKDFYKDNRTLSVSIKSDWNPKFCKERTLHLSNKLTGMIDGLPRKGDYIFIQTDSRSSGKKFSQSQMWRFIIDDFVKKLGIDGNFIKFRDTYASYSLACGVDMAKVQYRMGHKSLTETDKYSNAIHEPIGNDRSCNNKCVLW